MTLYHYFDWARGPLKSLTALSMADAEAVQRQLAVENRSFAAKRQPGYLARRRALEKHVRGLFIERGGRPEQAVPHSFVLAPCPWIAAWYPEPGVLAVPMEALRPDAVSFTYGDLFPTFSPRVRDQRPYRRRVYTLEEIRQAVIEYGLPQAWNPDGVHGPERYIEAQVWQAIPEACLARCARMALPPAQQLSARLLAAGAQHAGHNG